MTCGAYYNDSDPYCAAWIRNLISLDLIPDGDVDERSIHDVQPCDLLGYTQHHFFAGLGGWPYAARLANWPDDKPLWTGSPPCQPHSAAGLRKGTDDPRHLWPAYFGLVRRMRPNVIAGEQVTGAVSNGVLDGMLSDLEAENYAGGACVLPAISVGAPQLRYRLFYVASAEHRGRERRNTERRRSSTAMPSSRRAVTVADSDSAGFSNVAELDGQSDAGSEIQDRRHAERRRNQDVMVDSPGERRGARRPKCVLDGGRDSTADASASSIGALACAASAEWRPNASERYESDGCGSGREQASSRPSLSGAVAVGAAHSAGSSERPCERSDTRTQQPPAIGASWADAEWIIGGDGKARRVKSGVRLLAHGIPSRVAKLRALGNAIVSQVAAEFLRAYLDDEFLWD